MMRAGREGLRCVPQDRRPARAIGAALRSGIRKGAPVASAIGLFWALPAAACGYLQFGSPDTVLGRTVTITYDRILDRGCGGSFEPPSGIVTAPPRQGTVRIESGRYHYVASKAARGSDRFVLSGLYKNRPYKLVVNVTFR